MIRSTLWLVFLLTAFSPIVADDRSPRETETVALIKRCLPSVVAIRSYSPGDKPGVTNIDHGSGSVIHPAGFVLTNHHVIKRAERVEAVFSDHRVLPARIVAKYSLEDLAVLKVDGEQPFAVLPLGRSSDLMLGEPVLVIGTPAGLEHSVSTGIVSGLARAASTQEAFLPWMFQTSAAVNGGNSGGPVINAMGQQIGVVTSKKDDAENINFAITIDRVWQLFPQIVSAEVREGFWLGCEVGMSNTEARVTQVAADSPAAKAGMQIGDVIRTLGGLEVRNSIDFHLALVGHKPDESIEIEADRGAERLQWSATLVALPLAEPVAQENLTGGIKLSFYPGEFDRLPVFDQLTPKIEHPTQKVSLDTISGGRDNFALRFVGYIQVPADGLYVFFVQSDDGSRVRVGGKAVVENDGLHSAFEGGGYARLKAGLHPIVVEYFERGGAEALRLSWEGPNLPKQEIPPSAYFMPADAAK